MPEIKELLGKESLLAIKDYVDSTKSDVDHDLSLKEDKANKVTSLSDDSTDTEYPSAKAVYDAILANDNFEEITWAALKELRDNNQLIPGRFYRITDYECTTTTTNTNSAGHVFDIIVRADSANKLNEEASAIQHSGDTYFANSKLEAWKLWYSLDNDTSRFAWAQTTMEEHLVVWEKIYYREPQYDGVKGNYCWVSERDNDRFVFTDTIEATEGVEWERWGDEWIRDGGTEVVYYPATSEGKGVIYRMIDEFNNDIPYDFKNILFTKSGSYTNAYTFSCTENSVIKDGSLNCVECRINVIKEYVYSEVRQLNFTIFYSSSIQLRAISNYVDEGNHSNSFIGSEFKYNTIGSYFSSNTIGSYFSSNTIGSNFFSNTIGSNFSSNTIGSNFNYNTIGSNFFSNTIGSNFSSNTIGANFNYNTIGANFSGNEVGSYFSGNEVGSCFDGNKIGSSASENVYVSYCKFDDGVQYISLISNDSTTNCIQNVHIHSGVKGTEDEEEYDILYKTITVDRGLTYTTDVYPVGSTEMFI